MRRLDLPFPLLLALRSHLGANRSLTAITLLSIATAVALVSGLEMSSRSVAGELERTATELAGAAQIEVSAGGVGVPEALLERLVRTDGVRVAAPVVEASFRLDTGPRAGSSLHVLGVDLVADVDVRSYAFAGDEAGQVDALRLLGELGAVVVSDSFARELDLRLGSRLPVRHGDRRYELAVRGILAPEGIADAFGGRIAVADVFSLQTLLGREGWLDRIDVVAQPEVAVEILIERLTERCRGEATVRRSAVRDLWLESTLATVRLAVAVSVVVALAVAALLSYGAASLFVERRGHELALLRATGLETHRMHRFLYVDGLLLALAGTVLGLGVGLAISRGLFRFLSNVTDFLKDVQIERLELAPSTFVVALVTGLGVALAGVALPAWRAAREPPLEQLAAHRPSPPHALRVSAGLVPLAIAVAWAFLAAFPLSLSPLLRVALLLGLGLAFLVVAAGGFLPRLLAALRPALERALPGVGRLAGAFLVTRSLHTGIHVAAVAGVLAGVSVTAILGQSLARTLDSWTASQFSDGVFVTSEAGLSFRTEEHLRADVVEAIRGTPGVRAVFEQYGTQILYRGESVWLAASDMAVMADYGRLPALDADPRRLARAIADGQVAVSDGFAVRFAVDVGDSLALDTPAGSRLFTVAGRLRDYAGPTGSLNIDLRVFDELWSRPGARNVVVWADPPLADAVRRIEEHVAGRQQLFFAYGAELERYASRLLARFTHVLDLLAGLTALLGGVAVLNLLLGAIGERRRELGLLRSAGATRSQITALVVADGLVAGAVGGAAGLALGVVCARPLVAEIVPGALGWALDFSVEPRKLGLLLVGVAGASLLASLYPAWLARRAASAEVLAPE
jgi:putative ABC transport system permease protein